VFLKLTHNNRFSIKFLSCVITGGVPDGILANVYVWKDFSSDKYMNFLRTPGNLLLSMNTDWFQPYSKTIYSVGVIYLVILENIIIVGIIPGPKEPKLTMNSFIGPLVNELNSAFKGWHIPTNHPVLKSVLVRLCIGCVTCDIPLLGSYVVSLGMQLSLAWL